MRKKRNRVTCRLIAAMPPDRPLNRVLARHVAQCETCRETERRSTGLARDLHELGDETIAAPEEMATAVMTRLGPQDGSDPRRQIVRRLVMRYSAAGLVGLATVTALAARLLSRRRR
jgi:predicted anti-sigma-YlaC factor YlaD